MPEQKPVPEELVITGAALPDGTVTDVRIAGGEIAEVGTGLSTSGRQIDAAGCILLPGLVDLHTHLRQPGREDAETIASGSAAAAAGGFTAVLAMANTTPVTDTAEAANYVYGVGQDVDLVDVHPIGAVSRGLDGKELAELGLMAKSTARVRVFSDDGKCVADAGLMRRALEYVRAFDGVVSQHAQEPTLAGASACCHEGPVSGQLGLPGWPAVAEEVIVARDVLLAQATNSRVHIAHLTSGESVDIVRWAKARGIKVTAEVTPHHLMLPVEKVTGYDPVYKVNPPLRPTETIEALREGLADGTIDAVATDHAPHAAHDKDHAFSQAAFGMLGSETALSVIHTVMVQSGRMTWQQVADTMSHNPSVIAQLTPGSGAPAQGRPIAVGEPANLCLFDPTTQWVVDRATSASLSRNNPWHGVELAGGVRHTIRRGRVMYSHNQHRQEQV